MSSDEKMGMFVSYSIPLCIGLICGLLIFNPSDGFIIWFESIDWRSQGVANVGAWVAGISTSIAALATAFAAHSSSKAASAAQLSAKQWQLYASYEKYIDVGVKARIKLRWFEAHLNHMCENRFSVFSKSGQDIFFDSEDNDIEAFLTCLNGDFINKDSTNSKRFNKYKEQFKYQSDAIGKIKDNIIDLVEETFELSKNHTGITEIEQKVLRKEIEEFIGQINMVSHLYNSIFESDDSDRVKKVHIDSCLNCSDSSRHYYRSTLSNTKFLSGYIETLVITSDFSEWKVIKSDYIKEKQDNFRLITKDKGDFDEKVIESLSMTFGRL